MSRASRKVSEVIERVYVGDIDLMSHSARVFSVPLCGVVNSEHPSYRCTRAAGHDESQLNHPGTPHVAANSLHVAVAVW